MPLPINFLPEVRSKLDDAALIEKLKNEKKKSKLTSNNILDIIEEIRQDINEHLSSKMDMFEIVTSPARFEEFINNANEFDKVAIDTETTGLNPLVVDIIGFSMYFPGEKAIYVPVNHEDYLTGNKLVNQMTKEQIASILKKLTAKIIMHNAQFDIRIFKHTLGVIFHCWWDTQVAGCLIDENESHGLKDQHSKYISHVEEKTFSGYFKNIKYQQVPVELAYPYAANDASDTYELFEYQYEHFLNEKVDYWWLWRNVEIPMIDVIVELEDNGVYVDTKFLDTLRDKYHHTLDIALQACYSEIDKLQGKIDTYLLAHPQSKFKQPVNIGSNQQLGILFYDILGAKPMKGKKERSVDDDVMQALKDQYPLAAKITEYRSAMKMTSTYIDNIYNIIHTDGRVHTGFNSNGAVTGRMSSKEPLNLQNIPSRGKVKELRKMFAGQTLYRDIAIRSDNAYIFDRCEEVELNDGSWIWAEIVQKGDVLASGEKVKAVIVKDLKVLIGIETDAPANITGKLQARTRHIIQGSDYSAQEPRLLSQLCGDEGMLQAYRDGKDLYVEISSISYKRPYKMCLEHFPKGAPIKQCADGEHWEYAKLKTGEEDDIQNFEDFSRYLEEDFDPELYDYDKLANGDTDVFAEGKEYRSQAKRILLGIMYGRGAKSIAEQLFGTPKNKKEEEENTEKAKIIKENVYKAFPKIRTFEEDSIKKVKDHGYVSTLWGRRRRLPNYNLPPIQIFYVFKDNNGNETRLDDLSVVNPAKFTEVLGAYSTCNWGKRNIYVENLEKNEGIRIIDNNSKIAAAGRQIINSQVQGSAADMSKMALIKIHNDEELRKRKVKLIIPVHDEILIETPLRYAKYVKDRFAEDMMTAARPKLTIPVSCDVESSDRWYGETMDLDEVLKGLEGV